MGLKPHQLCDCEAYVRTMEQILNQRPLQMFQMDQLVSTMLAIGLEWLSVLDITL